MFRSCSPRTKLARWIAVSLLFLRAVGPGCSLAADPVRSAFTSQAEHVVVVVWDGMRPDFVTPQYTPTLWEVATNGVFFKAHHSTYVTSTEVNGVALATGVYPNKSGVLANREYRPEINWLESAATESVDTIRRSDAWTGGHYLGVPTLAELIQQAGFPTVVAGTKPVALLQDRSNTRQTPAALHSVMLYNGHAIPSTALTSIEKAVGTNFPASATPNVARDQWTARALTESLWSKGVPKFSLLWLSEPDASQHSGGPGCTNALAAVASSDRNLGLILRSLEEKGVREKTDVFVVSDHAFSTIQRGVDVAAALRKAKVKAERRLDDPELGQVLVVGLGGSVLFYVIGHEQTVIQKVVTTLQISDFAGVVFSRLRLPGTFPLEQVRLNVGRCEPDVVLSMRWKDSTNHVGVPGVVTTDGGSKGSGSHASLCRYDLHNTLVACGPDLRQGFVDELPTANVDLAPTVLFLLGLKPSRSMDGRVLTEALRQSEGVASKLEPKQQTLEATAELGSKHWYQYLKLTTLDGRVYLDEGNGECTGR